MKFLIVQGFDLLSSTINIHRTKPERMFRCLENNHFVFEFDHYDIHIIKTDEI